MSEENTKETNKPPELPKENKTPNLEVNKNTSQIKEIKKNFQGNTNNNIKKNDIHPLDFYTMGKVHEPIKTSTFSHNRGFRSTSNDLITRNLFSLNTTKYDNLKNDKFGSTLSKQNISENNYLRPLDVYNTFQKYSLPSNVINTETYNISKEKIFSKSDISTIRKGMHISQSNFMSYKKQLLTEISDSKNNLNISMKDKGIERKKTESDSQKKCSKNNEVKKLDKNDFVEKNNNNNSLINGITKPPIKYKNPIDISKKDLRSNFLYFDKNNQQFLRHKNWWIPDK